MILGKEAKDWADIYCLMVFYGEQPKSMKDLMRWEAPCTPRACLNVGLDLMEARKISPAPVLEWVETLLRECKL